MTWTICDAMSCSCSIKTKYVLSKQEGPDFTKLSSIRADQVEKKICKNLFISQMSSYMINKKLKLKGIRCAAANTQPWHKNNILVFSCAYQHHHFKITDKYRWSRSKDSTKVMSNRLHLKNKNKKAYHKPNFKSISTHSWGNVIN